MRTKISNSMMTVDQAKAHMTSIGERVLTVTNNSRTGGFSVYSVRSARGTMGDSAVSIESDSTFGTFLYH